MSFYSHLPGEIIKQFRVKGNTHTTITPASTIIPLHGTEKTLTITSNDNVVEIEVNLQTNVSTEDTLIIIFYRDSTEIYRSAQAMAPVTGTSSMSNTFKWIDRPGLGTYIYSIRVASFTTVTFIDGGRSSFKYSIICLPEDIFTINSNTFTFGI